MDTIVTMWCYNEEERFELVNLYILHILWRKYCNREIGSYRDGRLPFFKYESSVQMDWTRHGISLILKKLDQKLQSQFTSSS